MSDDLQVLIRDRDLQIVDEISHEVSFTVDATLRNLYADDWTVTFPATAGRYLQPLRQPGAGVVIVQGDTVLTSGPLRTGSRSRGSAEDQPGSVSVSGQGDTCDLAARLTFPTPAASLTGQAAYAYQLPSAADILRASASGSSAPRPTAEDALLTTVRDQTGPTAQAKLQIAHLVLPASLGRGRQVTVSERFTPLGDTLRKIAGSELGFRIVQNAEGSRRLEVRAAADRSADVRFSAGLGTLPNYDFTWQAPSVTDVLVAAGGQGLARLLRAYSDDAAANEWAMRAWAFQDRRDVNATDDPHFEETLAQAGTETLTAGVAQAAMTMQPVAARNGPSFSPTGDYWLGDSVAIELEPTVQTIDVLQAMHVQFTPEDGLVLTPTVGGPTAADPTPAEVRQTRALEARLLALLAAQ